MKRLVILFLFLLFSAGMSWGQEKELPYLYPEFQNGRVVHKNGDVFDVQLNYSLISNTFIFIDTNDNNIEKEIDETEKISYITVGEHLFLINNQNETVEVVQYENPKVFVLYDGKLFDRGSETGYGGRVDTPAASSLSSHEVGGRSFQLKSDRWVISGMDKEYQVEREGRMKRFANLKQFLKIYPRQNSAAIEAFIVDNAVDFDSVEQVIALCNYAESLD